ncbi:hypothetical protein [Microbacterium sp. 179-I 3D3 NHS]|uniref:hypothetical protein n=1 Tax=Microbacterium sp. 179-I 3D3 NHS TaxID=3142382 RepID=UPI0039A0300C
MGIGSSVVRPMKNALDDMPVHVKQLAEMFRKHGRKQDRNTSEVQNLDSADIVHPLQNAWRSDTDWTPNDIVNAGQGNRPNPESYLDADYIQQHLARFDDGASRIYFSDSLHTWGPGNRGSTFVFPTSELQTILDETGGDATQLAIRLGLDPGDFYDPHGNPWPVEIRHFEPSELENLRIPSGNEGGANPQWIPGGYLPAGLPEAVIDVPETATGIGDVANGGNDYNPGMWPGTAQGLSLH